MKLLPFSKIQSGFTLVELIVVIAIVGIMGGMVITILNPIAQLQKGADTKRKSDLAQISKALESYYSDHGKYPSTNASYELVVIPAGSNDPIALSWGSTWEPYMDVLPKDAAVSKKYIYYTPTTGSGAFQSYYLYASLERGTKDPQACTGATGCPNVPSGVTCGTSTDLCNYGVTSSNVSP